MNNKYLRWLASRKGTIITTLVLFVVSIAGFVQHNWYSTTQIDTITIAFTYGYIFAGARLIHIGIGNDY